MAIEEYDCVTKKRIIEMISEPFLERYGKDGWKPNKTKGNLQLKTDFGYSEIILAITGRWPLEQAFSTFFPCTIGQ